MNVQQYLHVITIVLGFTAGAAIYFDYYMAAGALTLFAIPAIQSIGLYLASGQDSSAGAPTGP